MTRISKLESLKRRNYLSSNGFDSLDYVAWLDKSRGPIDRAKQRGLVCTLDFYGYMQKIIDAGITHPSMIGLKRDQYQLSRFGDVGGYTKENCRFITQQENIAERKLNGGDIKIGKNSKKLKGRDKSTHLYINKRSDDASKNFELIAPNGEVITGRNLNQYCKDNGFRLGRFGYAIKNKVNTRDGWSAKYLS